MKNLMKVLFLVNTKCASYDRGSASFKSGLLLKKRGRCTLWSPASLLEKTKESGVLQTQGLLGFMLSEAGGEGTVPIL